MKKIIKSYGNTNVIVLNSEDMKAYNLDSFIRVTIGTEQENRKFKEAFRKAISCKL